MRASNRGGIGVSYRPARLHRRAEFNPWNRFFGLHKSLKIRALAIDGVSVRMGLVNYSEVKVYFMLNRAVKTSSGHTRLLKGLTLQ